jgi:hypothetical protein
MNITRFKLFFLLALTGFTLYSQSRDEQIKKGIDYIYQLKSDSASAIFQTFIEQDPKDPTGYFFISVV